MNEQGFLKGKFGFVGNIFSQLNYIGSSEWSLFMLKIDHFASLFRAADKEQVDIPDVLVSRVALITDVSKEESNKLWERWKGIFPTPVEIILLDGTMTQSLPLLIEALNGVEVDLVVTYRCLHSDAWKYPYAVGSYIEVLTQIVSFPVLLMPHIHEDMKNYANAKQILLMSSELTKESALVGFANAFATKNSSLLLAQIDDKSMFLRIIDIISKIPQIDTDDAKQYISQRREQEMNDWVFRCKQSLSQKSNAPVVSQIDMLDPSMKQCAEVIEKHKADLVVINTKDDEQLAIHGLAYPIMVQFRHIPLLLR